jgi:hypothetical protein
MVSADFQVEDKKKKSVSSLSLKLKIDILEFFKYSREIADFRSLDIVYKTGDKFSIGYFLCDLVSSGR